MMDDTEDLPPMNQEQMEEFISANYAVLEEDWTEALVNGWEDIVFLWQIEGEDINHVCILREHAITVLEASGADIPEDTRKQLEGPAGEGRAWLLFTTPTWFASMCVEYVKDIPRGN